jgi:uncharacterized protein
MPNFSILLPSSNKQVDGGNPLAPDMFDYRTSNTFNYFNNLNQDRRALINALQVAVENPDIDSGALLSATGDDLESLIQTNQNILTAPLMSALERYSQGVLYQAADFTSLPTGAQRRLLEEGIIFSGLFGLLRPDDLIPMYRLGMGVDVPEIGRPSDYWRDAISENLNQALVGRFVWNMLPPEYEEAWDDNHSYDAMVRLVFARRNGEEVVPVKTDVLPLYGKVVSLIVQETLESLDEVFWEWKHPSGYRPVESLSSYDEETKTHTVMMVKRR